MLKVNLTVNGRTAPVIGTVTEVRQIGDKMIMVIMTATGEIVHIDVNAVTSWQTSENIAA